MEEGKALISLVGEGECSLFIFSLHTGHIHKKGMFRAKERVTSVLRI